MRLRRKRAASQNLFVILIAAAAPAHPTHYVIDTTVESVLGDGLCGLREAIRAAATDAARDVCPAGELVDSIELPSGVYHFDLGDELVPGPGTLSITGHYPPNTTIDLAQGGTFLLIHGGASVSLASLTIENGFGWEGESAIVAFESDLHIENVVLAANAGFLNGGALTFIATTPKELVVQNSAIVGNSSPSGGGALVDIGAGANAAFRDTSFSNNTANAGGGLALHVGNGSEAMCARCDFGSNTAESYAGAALVGVSGSGVARLVDVSFFRNQSGTGSSPTTLLVDAGSGGSVEIDRMIDLGGGFPTNSEVSDLVLRSSFGGNVVLTNALLANGEAEGLYALATQSGSIRISHATLTDFVIGGTLISESGGLVRLENSIAALNGIDLLVTPSGVELESNLIGEDPFFDGPFPGYYPGAGSAAIDACDSPLAPVRVADASHRPRLTGLAPDCGAYESSPGIFADGFETGDGGSWGLLLPGL